jgi:hypothetical protein
MLERVGNATQFTRFATAARLTVPQGGDAEKARKLLGRAEYACLIANSLRGERTLSVEVITGEADHDPADDLTDDPSDDPDGQPTDEIGGPARAKELERMTGQLS